LIVNVGEVVGPVRRQPPHDREEALVGAVLTESIVERHEQRLVRGTDGSQTDARAVLEGDLPIEHPVQLR
jgi:hypothetical protein